MQCHGPASANLTHRQEEKPTQSWWEGTNEKGGYMRKRFTLIVLLGSLLLPPLVLISCESGPEPFALGECRLGDQDCQLQ